MASSTAGRAAPHCCSRAGEEVGRKALSSDETFRFPSLGAGEYVVAVEGTAFRSPTTRVNGRDQVMLDLTLVLHAERDLGEGATASGPHGRLA